MPLGNGRVVNVPKEKMCNALKLEMYLAGITGVLEGCKDMNVNFLKRRSKMSNNHTENDFSQDYGKTIPIYRDIFISPINHRKYGLRTGVYHIHTICLNHQEFCIDGHWFRIEDYRFGAVEPDGVKEIESKQLNMLTFKKEQNGI